MPFPPAGVTDIITRLVAQKLSEKLGQQFYIENVAGAAGNLGMAQAARAPGDGYTILFSSSSFVVNPSLYNKVPYDWEKDFIPVTKAGATPNSWQIKPVSSADHDPADRPVQKGAGQAERRLARPGHDAVAVDRDAAARPQARFRRGAVLRRRAADPVDARRPHPDRVQRHRQRR